MIEITPTTLTGSEAAVLVWLLLFVPVAFTFFSLLMVALLDIPPRKIAVGGLVGLGTLAVVVYGLLALVVVPLLKAGLWMVALMFGSMNYATKREKKK